MQEKRVLPDLISVIAYNPYKFWLNVTERAEQKTGFFEAQKIIYNIINKTKVLSFSIFLTEQHLVSAEI